MNLVLFDASEVEKRESRETVRLASGDARAVHLVTVLAATVGQTVRCGVVGGAIAPFVVEAVVAGSVILRRTGPFVPPPPKPIVSVWLGHPRPIVLKRILRDLACIGIPRIVVVDTELGEKSYRDSKLWKDRAYERLFLEGMAQGGDTRMPELLRECSVADAVGQGTTSATCLLLDPGAESKVNTLVQGAVSARRPVVVAVGPERGFTRDEQKRFAEAGFLPCALGPRTLRTETAAVAAAVLCASVLDLIHESQ